MTKLKKKKKKKRERKEKKRNIEFWTCDLEYYKKKIYRPSYPEFYKILPHLLHLSLALLRCHFTYVKTSLTFKCLIEHLLADFSYSRPLDTYLWKQMMKMNRNITYKWCNIDKKHLLFTKRKCHKFSWLFTASRYSPRRRLICACRIACKVLVSIGLKSLSFSFLKKGFFLGKPYPEIRWPSPVPFYKHGFPRRKLFFRKPKLNE